MRVLARGDVGKRGEIELGRVVAETVDDEGRIGGGEFPAVSGGCLGFDGSGFGQVAIGGDAAERLRIEEAGGGGQARVDVDLGAVAPDEQLVARLSEPAEERGGGA